MNCRHMRFNGILCALSSHNCKAVQRFCVRSLWLSHFCDERNISMTSWTTASSLRYIFGQLSRSSDEIDATGLLSSKYELTRDSISDSHVSARDTNTSRNVHSAKVCCWSRTIAANSCSCSHVCSVNGNANKDI